MASSTRPVALVTGASAGIGAALAREAANDGHDLVLVARRRESMEVLAAELKSTGAEITIIPADLGKAGAAAALMETVEQRGLSIDTLINNAGLGDTGRFDKQAPERILSMLQVNVVALTELTRAGVAADGGAQTRQGHAPCIPGCVPAWSRHGNVLCN
jgi:uncharacterized protein